KSTSCPLLLCPSSVLSTNRSSGIFWPWPSRRPEAATLRSSQLGRLPPPGALAAAPAERTAAVGRPLGAVADLGIAAADLDAALRLVAHQHYEIGGLAGLPAQGLVGDDQRRARPHDFRDALGSVLRDRDPRQRELRAGQIGGTGAGLASPIPPLAAI